MLRHYFAIAVAAVCVAFQAPRVGSADTVPAKKHALLIGCTAYPALSRRLQLQGPANDVALTAELLRNRFGFAAGDIVVLVHENEALLRPTYHNIVRAFEALIDRAADGDDVFILIGGHGSQLKDDNPDDPADVELDALDEVFLSEDTEEWSPNKQVAGVIRDDQIRGWLDSIRARGAFVFFVADTCHAGTLARGELPFDEEEIEEEAEDEVEFYRQRHVDPLLISPPDAFDDWPPESTSDIRDGGRGSNEGSGLGDGQSESDSKRGGLVELYAVDEHTLEAEHPMPPDSRTDGPRYGRLSYALNWVLARSGEKLNYRLLAKQLRWQYESWGWNDLGYMLGPSSDLDREVLGKGSWEDRYAVTLKRDEFGRLSIDVGLLQNATVGSVYAVYPHLGAERRDAAVGYVQVTEATIATARVEPCAFSDIALIAADHLPSPGRCELAYAASSSLKTSVAVEPMSESEDPADFPKDIVDVEAFVRDLADAPNSIIRVWDEVELPDAMLLVDGDEIYLRRTEDALNIETGYIDLYTDEERFPSEGFGPFVLDSGPQSKLAQALRTMAKAINLRRAAMSETETLSGDDADRAVTIRLQVERWNDRSQRYEAVDALRPLETGDGEKLRVSVFNEGVSPVDVTILTIESTLRIRSCFPTLAEANGGAQNRISSEGGPAVVEFSISDGAIGLQDLIVVATLSKPAEAPQNFVFLEQPGLSLDPMDAATSSVNTPAGQVLATATFGRRGDRGGSAAADLATYAVRRLSWKVRGRPSTEP